MAALRAVSGRDGPMTESASNLAAELFRSGTTMAVRVRSAEMLATSRLSPAQVGRLADLVEQAGPMELKALVLALEGNRDAATGPELIRALPQAPGFFGLSVRDVRRAFADSPDAVSAEAETLVAKLVERAQDREAHLSDLQAALEDGDPERGRHVFLSGTGSCVVCHRIGDTGGEIGPDLSTIGRSRSVHELLDSIVYPESDFVRGYETYTIVTRDGNACVGTVPRETPDTVYVTDVTGESIAVPRSQIEKREPSPTSLMPSGLDRLLSRRELGDVVAYLRSLN